MKLIAASEFDSIRMFRIGDGGIFYFGFEGKNLHIPKHSIVNMEYFRELKIHDERNQFSFNVVMELYVIKLMLLSF